MKSRGKISSIQKVFFSFLALGFTLISAWNGFNFYRIIFGLSMSVLIVSVFEIARIACLFRFMYTREKTGFLAIMIYTMVASVCAFAAINSFTSEVVYRNRESEREFKIQALNIKQDYSKKTEAKLVAINRDIRYLENKVAKYHNSDYWKRRLSQVIINRDKIISERDRFLNTDPGNLEKWVKVHSALLGLNMKQASRENNEMASITQALKDLWGMGKDTAQKIIGIVITVTVELSILLLSFLGSAQEASYNDVTNESPGRTSLSRKLDSRFGNILVNKFIQKNRSYFKKTGNLLPMRKLSNNLRPVRRFFQDIGHGDITELFKSHNQEKQR